MKYVYGAQKVNAETGERGVMYYFTNRKRAVKFIRALIEVEEEIQEEEDATPRMTFVHGVKNYYGIVERLLIHK